MDRKPGRRSSILKRRSRSQSPKRSPTANIKHRKSRRISFSEQIGVREFAINEIMDTIWVASYEKPTELTSTSEPTAVAANTQTNTPSVLKSQSTNSNAGISSELEREMFDLENEMLNCSSIGAAKLKTIANVSRSASVEMIKCHQGKENQISESANMNVATKSVTRASVLRMSPRKVPANQTALEHKSMEMSIDMETSTSLIVTDGPDQESTPISHNGQPKKKLFIPSNDSISPIDISNTIMPPIHSAPKEALHTTQLGTRSICIELNAPIEDNVKILPLPLSNNSDMDISDMAQAGTTIQTVANKPNQTVHLEQSIEMTSNVQYQQGNVQLNEKSRLQERIVPPSSSNSQATQILSEGTVYETLNMGSSLTDFEAQEIACQSIIVDKRNASNTLCFNKTIEETLYCSIDANNKKYTAIPKSEARISLANLVSKKACAPSIKLFQGKKPVMPSGPNMTSTAYENNPTREIIMFNQTLDESLATALPSEGTLSTDDVMDESTVFPAEGGAPYQSSVKEQAVANRLTIHHNTSLEQTITRDVYQENINDNEALKKSHISVHRPRSTVWKRVSIDESSNIVTMDEEKHAHPKYMVKANRPTIYTVDDMDQSINGDHGANVQTVVPKKRFTIITDDSIDESPFSRPATSTPGQRETIVQNASIDCKENIEPTCEATKQIIANSSIGINDIIRNCSVLNMSAQLDSVPKPQDVITRKRSTIFDSEAMDVTNMVLNGNQTMHTASNGRKDQTVFSTEQMDESFIPKNATGQLNPPFLPKNAVASSRLTIFEQKEVDLTLIPNQSVRAMKTQPVASIGSRHRQTILHNEDIDESCTSIVGSGPSSVHKVSLFQPGSTDGNSVVTDFGTQRPLPMTPDNMDVSDLLGDNAELNSVRLPKNASGRVTIFKQESMDVTLKPTEMVLDEPSHVGVGNILVSLKCQTLSTGDAMDESTVFPAGGGAIYQSSVKKQAEANRLTIHHNTSLEQTITSNTDQENIKEYEAPQESDVLNCRPRSTVWKNVTMDESSNIVMVDEEKHAYPKYMVEANRPTIHSVDDMDQSVIGYHGVNSQMVIPKRRFTIINDEKIEESPIATIADHSKYEPTNAPTRTTIYQEAGMEESLRDEATNTPSKTIPKRIRLTIHQQDPMDEMLPLASMQTIERCVQRQETMKKSIRTAMDIVDSQTHRSENLPKNKNLSISADISVECGSPMEKTSTSKGCDINQQISTVEFDSDDCEAESVQRNASVNLSFSELNNISQFRRNIVNMTAIMPEENINDIDLNLDSNCSTNRTFDSLEKSEPQTLHTAIDNRSELISDMNVRPNEIATNLRSSIPKMSESFLQNRRRIKEILTEHKNQDYNIYFPVDSDQINGKNDRILRRNSANSNIDESFVPKNVSTKFVPRQFDFSFYYEYSCVEMPLDIIRRLSQSHPTSKTVNSQLKEAERAIDEMGDPRSQNVEAPNYSFLHENAIQMGDEALRERLEQERAARPPGAPFPVPSEFFFMLRNKFCSLQNWTYNGNDYYHLYCGRPRMLHKLIPMLMLVIRFDPDNIVNMLTLHDKVLFKEIYFKQNTKQLPQSYPIHHRLITREVLRRLPAQLETNYPSTTELTQLFDYLHQQVTLVHKQVICIARLALSKGVMLRQHNDLQYLRMMLTDVDTFVAQEIIILLEDINSTGPKQVKTQPRCTYHDAIYHLQRGIGFIEAILQDPFRYINIPQRTFE